MATSKSTTQQGGCGCGYVKYQVTTKPLIVHCCHCSYCQTQTGSAFVLNALFEASEVELLQGEVKEIITPSPSGNGQTIARCPICKVAIWSNYFMGGLKDKIRFVRVGTFDDPMAFPPDVHIFTETKLPWIQPPAEQPVYDEFYKVDEVWSEDNYLKLNKMKEEFKQTNQS